MKNILTIVVFFGLIFGITYMMVDAWDHDNIYGSKQTITQDTEFTKKLTNNYK